MHAVFSVFWVVFLLLIAMASQLKLPISLQLMYSYSMSMTLWLFSGCLPSSNLHPHSFRQQFSSLVTTGSSVSCPLSILQPKLFDSKRDLITSCFQTKESSHCVQEVGHTLPLALDIIHHLVPAYLMGLPNTPCCLKGNRI